MYIVHMYDYIWVFRQNQQSKYPWYINSLEIFRRIRSDWLEFSRRSPKMTFSCTNKPIYKDFLPHLGGLLWKNSCYDHLKICIGHLFYIIIVENHFIFQLSSLNFFNLPSFIKSYSIIYKYINFYNSLYLQLEKIVSLNRFFKAKNYRKIKCDGKLKQNYVDLVVYAEISISTV